MTHDELRKSLHRRAQDLAEWFEGTLEIHESRTDAEVEAVSRAIIRVWGQPEPEEEIDNCERYLHFWTASEHDFMPWIGNTSKMNSEMGFNCTPPLEVAEYGLVVGLILARSAVKYFQSKSNKRHLVAAHLLSDATEARDYWIVTRGISRCRNPDMRSVEVENKMQQWESKNLFRESQSRNGLNAANIRHDKPGGSREKRKNICELWATGNYTNRDICADEEYAALGISRKTARTALINTPEPSPWPAKKQSMKR